MDPMDVVHFKIPGSVNWLRGNSPITSARYAINAYLEADRTGYKKLQNRAIPGGLLSTEQKVDDEERRKFLAAWKFHVRGKRQFESDKRALIPLCNNGYSSQWMKLYIYYRDTGGIQHGEFDRLI